MSASRSMAWVAPTFVSALTLLLLLVLASVVVTVRKVEARRRRSDLAYRRLRALGDLPGELTHAMPWPALGDHAAEAPAVVPMSQAPEAVREAPRHLR